jgi:hypothetical protein
MERQYKEYIERMSEGLLKILSMQYVILDHCAKKAIETDQDELRRGILSAMDYFHPVQRFLENQKFSPPTFSKVKSIGQMTAMANQRDSAPERSFLNAFRESPSSFEGPYRKIVELVGIADVLWSASPLAEKTPEQTMPVDESHPMQ